MEGTCLGPRHREVAAPAVGRGHGHEEPEEAQAMKSRPAGGMTS